MDPMQPYRAPLWLRGGHLQTIYASALMPRPRVAYRRERWDTPDGDFIDLDWVVNPAVEVRRINLSGRKEFESGSRAGENSIPVIMEPAPVPLLRE